MTEATDAKALIEAGLLGAGIPAALVSETLQTYAEAKKRFHIRDFMPNAVEGGRFTEAVLRILEWQSSGIYTPIGDPLFKADKLILQLESKSHCSDSVRFHIPRALRVIYAIRNKRDTGHLGDGIDPNTQDATLVVSAMDWVLAELIRMHHNVPPAEAQALIEQVVTREVPLIEVFNGKPRILKDMKASEHLLVLLFWQGQRVAHETLRSWLPASMTANYKRTLKTLHGKHLIHDEGGFAQLTSLGQKYVADEGLIRPL